MLDNAGEWPATDIGDAFAGEAVREGWTGNKLLGREVVAHIKDDITKSSTKHRVWSFATELGGRKYCGVNYILDDGGTPLSIDKVHDQYSFMAMGYFAFTIINTASVAESKQQ